MNAIAMTNDLSKLTVEEIILKINDAKNNNNKKLHEELMIRAKDFIDENSFIIYADNKKEYVGRIMFHVKEDNIFEKTTQTKYFDTTIEYIKGPFKIEEESFNHRFNERYFTQVKEASKVDAIATLMNMRCNYIPSKMNKITDIFTARDYEFFSESIKRIVNNEKYFEREPEFSENYFLVGITPATRTKNGWDNDKIIYKPVITEQLFSECYLESTIKNLIKDKSFKEQLDIPSFDGYAIEAYSVPKMAQKIIESNDPMTINLTYKI